MRRAREGNFIAQIEIAGNEVTVAADLAEHALEFRDEAAVALHVVLGVVKCNGALLIYQDAIVGVRQIFRSEPKIDGVLGHDVERHAGCEGRSARPQGLQVGLSEHLDMTQGIVPIFGTEVIIIHSKGFLEGRGIGALR